MQEEEAAAAPEFAAITDYQGAYQWVVTSGPLMWLRCLLLSFFCIFLLSLVLDWIKLLTVVDFQTVHAQLT